MTVLFLPIESGSSCCAPIWLTLPAQQDHQSEIPHHTQTLVAYIWDTNTPCHRCYGATTPLQADWTVRTLWRYTGRSSFPVPDHSVKHLKSCLLYTLRCIPGEHAAAHGCLICSWWMLVRSSIKLGQGAGEVGVVVHSQWAKLWLSDRQPTATVGGQGHPGGAQDRSQSSDHTLLTPQFKKAKEEFLPRWENSTQHSLINIF